MCGRFCLRILLLGCYVEFGVIKKTGIASGLFWSFVGVSVLIVIVYLFVEGTSVTLAPAEDMTTAVVIVFAGGNPTKVFKT